MPHFTQFDKRLGFAFAVTCTVMLAVAGSGLWTLQKGSQQNDRLLSNEVDALILVEQARSELNTQFSIVPAYILQNEPLLIVRLKNTHQKFMDVLQQVADLNKDPARNHKIRLLRELDQQAYATALEGLKLAAAGQTSSQVNRFFQKNASARTRQMDQLMDEVVQAKFESLRLAHLNSSATVTKLKQGFIFACLFGFFLVFLIGVLLLRLARDRRKEQKLQALVLDTERRLAIARKEALEMLSHDLKNPLSSIKLNVQLLSRLSSQPEKLEKSLLHCSRSLRTMEDLIDKILIEAKTETGNLEVEKRDCDIQSLIDLYVTPLEIVAANKGVRLSSQILSDERVECDPVRVGEVLSNLIGNAIKFTSPGGSIRIQVKRTTDYLEFSVSDTGSGIEPEQLEYVFDRYWQAERTSKKGTGLGLSICKGIVEAHGGQIRVESQLGWGTTFIFSLPLLAQSLLGQPGLAAKSGLTRDHVELRG